MKEKLEGTDTEMPVVDVVGSPDLTISAFNPLYKYLLRLRGITDTLGKVDLYKNSDLIKFSEEQLIVIFQFIDRSDFCYGKFMELMKLNCAPMLTIEQLTAVMRSENFSRIDVELIGDRIAKMSPEVIMFLGKYHPEEFHHSANLDGFLNSGDFSLENAKKFFVKRVHELVKDVIWINDPDV